MNLQVSSIFSLVIKVAVRLCALPVVGFLAEAQEALTIREDFWRTDGPIRAIAVSSNAAYIGGQFSYVGRQTGGAGKIEVTSAEVDKSFPRVDGFLLAAVPDGSGGWFVGGAFTNIGGTVRTNLARIRSDNSVDPDWNPSPNGAVVTLTQTEQRVYVGGAFTAIGGQPRVGIAALDKATADASPWNPSASDVVRAIVVAGNTIYVGGSFTVIGGQARNRLAALDAETGLANAWNPDASGNGAIIISMALAGQDLYVCGTFNSVGTKPRNHLAALDLVTGVATVWNAHANGPVNALAVAGNTLYVGGQFSSIGNENRNRLAALDAVTARALEWNPNPNADVYALVVSGNSVYAGGSFSSIGGVPRSLMAELEISTGRATGWQQTFSSFATNATPTVISLTLSGTKLVAGGTFASVGGAARNNLASLDTTSGEVTPWNPNSDGLVSALGVYNNVVYVGGAFANLGGQPRNLIAAVNPTTGVATGWNPNATGTAFGTVLALAFADSRIFFAGSFSSIAGRSRNSLAAVHLDTGALSAWDPSPALSNLSPPTIAALQIAGNTAYLGGNFESIGGQPRLRLAAVSVSNGTALPWNPAPNDVVTALAIAGNIVHVGGNFTTIGGQARNRIAAVDADLGLATDWNPDADGPSAIVLALARAGNSVFVGGQFASIGGEFRNRLASLNTDTEHAASWNPNANAPVRTLLVTGDAVYVGGDFTAIGGAPFNYFAVFSRRPVLVPESAVLSSDHQFSFIVIAPEGKPLITQASLDLVQWLNISTNFPTGTPLVVTDTQATNFPFRFYRTVVGNSP